MRELQHQLLLGLKLSYLRWFLVDGISVRCALFQFRLVGPYTQLAVAVSVMLFKNKNLFNASITVYFD
jgi:hypothetical protein